MTSYVSSQDGIFVFTSTPSLSTSKLAQHQKPCQGDIDLLVGETIISPEV